jgi:hypothetical protein
MKNVIIAILLVVSIALGGLLLLQRHNQAVQARARLAAAQREVADLQADVAEREARAASLREKLDKSVAESAVNAGQAAQLSQALTNQVQAFAAEATNTKPANPLAEMFKNPEMRDLIKQQQQVAMTSIVDKNYADFIKTRQMSPEQAARLKELIAKKMAVGTDLGMEMMSGDLTAEQRADLMKRVKTDTDAIGAELKDLLGTDNYAAYETYEKSLPDRMAVSGFKDQLASGGTPLNNDQEQQLIQAMMQEREGFKFTTDFANQTTPSEDMFSRLNEDTLNAYFQEQEQLNQRYLARAQTILSPEQYTAYQKSLVAQQELGKMGMKMAAQMFGQPKGAK